VDTQLERLKAGEGHGFWEESPDLDAANVAAVTSVARYTFAKGLGITGRALDIGCGKCYGGRLLSESCSVVNYDLSLEALIWGRRHSRRRGLFVCGDAIRLPFQDGMFELITALEIIEHVPASGAPRFLKEIKKEYLKKGGALLSRRLTTLPFQYLG